MAQVSVVIPVYNVAPYLRQCLNSVVNQTLRDIEIICIDDGSTDETPAILKKYADQDERVQIITQKNGGPGAARNTGMAKAAGKYLIFLDSDDWFELNFLERMARRADETSADVVICKSVEFDTRTNRENASDWMLKEQYIPGEVFAPLEIAPYLFQFTYGWPWDKLYRREYLVQSGLTYPHLRNSEDLVFVFPSLSLAHRICVERSVFVHHRVNRKASVSNSRHIDSEAVFQALELFQKRLEESNVYALYEQSFLNWVVEFLIWNVSNMDDRTVQKACFDRLKTDYRERFNFDRYPKAFFIDTVLYYKCRIACLCPSWFFFRILDVYHWLKGKKRALKRICAI